MASYVFPAVFHAEEQGMYSVFFPDVEGCYTAGEGLAEAIKMAEDALALTMFHYEQEGRAVPSATKLADVKAGEGELATLVACDTMSYRMRNSNRAVKKTLSIPQWLNEEATAAGLNFSQVLQEALKAKLDLGNP